MSSSIDTTELFHAVLHRAPSEWELGYWSQELVGAGFDIVFRRLTDCDEHKRFANDRELMFVPAGHFYSPIVDQEFVGKREAKIFAPHRTLYGIDLRHDAQMDFVLEIAATEPKLPFAREPKAGLRYHYDNGAFVFGDAVVYAAMLLAHKPKRILEVGSGFSSALALDVIDMIPDYRPEVRFIDPYPELVRELVSSTADNNVVIERSFIQDVPPEKLAYLEAGDIYFMDTTHIVKTGSDVIYHFEEILPLLKSGVIIHLHDIFYPMEYPKTWAMDHRLSWNEIYYFRTFIANNAEYEILFWNDYMHRNQFEIMAKASATFAHNGGASIWLRKK